MRSEADAYSTDELTALYRIAALATAHGDVDLVMREIVRIVEEVVPCERTLMFLHDETRDDMQLHGDGVRVSLTEPSVLRRVFTSGSAEVVNDLVSDVDSSYALNGLGAHQLAGVPLSAGGRDLGVLLAVNSRRGAFSGDDLRLLTLLADRAALTIETAQLVGALQRQVQELEGLHRFSRLLTSSESVEHVIGESIAMLLDLIRCEKMAVLLHDEDADVLVAHPPVMGMDAEQVAQLRVPMSEPSLAGMVFRTHTAQVSNSAATDSWVNARLRELLEMESLLAVPLSNGPRPTGILMAVNAKGGCFEENDVRLAGLLAQRVGSVIEASLGRERERALMRKLREADRTKSEFVSMLAHELSGPMTTITGLSQLLRDRGEDLEKAKRVEMLQLMSKETGRLTRLVNDLLDLSRMEAGTLRYELEPLSLAELVESIMQVHTSLKRDHIVSCDVPNDLPSVLGDKDRIRQVLLNLLTNATRYSPEGTIVTISAEVQAEDDRFVRVAVRDEGIGIAPEDIGRIFAKFAMLPKPAWAKKGTGLGLYITKGIVEAHGGRIWVESERGVGSTFWFTLRVAPDAAATRSPGAAGSNAF